MEKQEILQAFKQAEIDWSKDNDNYGLCSYFCYNLDIDFKLVNKFIKPLWLKYATSPDRHYHFRNSKQRLEAIRKVIHELENEL